MASDGKAQRPEGSAQREARSEPIPTPEGQGGGEELAARLLRTTEAMASLCAAPQDLWNEHSNACLEAARLLSSPRVEGLEPVSYAVVGDNDAFRPLIEKAIQRDGSELWKVSRGGAVLNKLGEWEYEPSPSSRDDEFLKRCRYATLADAAASLRTNRPTAIDGVF